MYSHTWPGLLHGILSGSLPSAEAEVEDVTDTLYYPRI
jgi:hypothetical protein